jgi:hypothetical protein
LAHKFGDFATASAAAAPPLMTPEPTQFGQTPEPLHELQIF